MPGRITNINGNAREHHLDTGVSRKRGESQEQCVVDRRLSSNDGRQRACKTSLQPDMKILHRLPLPKGHVIANQCDNICTTRRSST